MVTAHSLISVGGRSTRVCCSVRAGDSDEEGPDPEDWAGQGRVVSMMPTQNNYFVGLSYSGPIRDSSGYTVNGFYSSGYRFQVI